VPESIRTDHIRFEPLGEAHLEGLARMALDPDVQRFTRVPAPPPPDFAHTWLARYETGRREGTREGFAILDAADGSFVGLAAAPKLDREAKTVELGYLVAPEARGRGIASAALWRLTRWAFDELGAVRLELLISVGNDASKRVARRCGYTFEGVLRSLHLKQGVRADTEIWSKLAGE
jgi:RimJ/RimL family protein N-acetyltransferase